MRFGATGVLCKGTTRAGSPCCANAVPGLDYCLHHVADDQLEEAEAIMGFQRCRHRFSRDDRCLFYAVKGTVPPLCKVHGANRGSKQRQQAAMRVIEQQVAQREAEIMVAIDALAHGDRETARELLAGRKRRC